VGHTVWSQRIVADIILNELKSYGKALNNEDQLIYSRLLKEPLKHLGSVSYTSSLNAWAFLLLSIMVEQEKRIRQLEETYVADGHLQEQE